MKNKSTKCLFLPLLLLFITACPAWGQNSGTTTIVCAANADDAYLDSMVFGEIPDVFSALKIPQKIIKAPASMSVISAHDIRQSGARTIGDLLKYVPGLYVTSSRSGFDLLKVRGSQDRYNNRILLIIDGIPHRELYHGYTSISELVPVENIERLEVIRGPGSALYGTNAYTGVISIFTKTATSSQTLQMDAGYGEFDTHRVNISFGKPMGNDSSLTLNARQLGSGGYDIDRGRDGYPSSETTDKDGYNLDAKFKFKDFNFIASLASLDYDYPWSKFDRNKDRQETNYTFGMQYHHALNETLEINFNLYDNIFNFREDLTKYNTDGSIKEFDQSIQENSIIGVDSHLIYKIFPANQLVAGVAIEQESTGRDEENSTIPGQPTSIDVWIQNNSGDRDFSLLNYAFYLEDNWKITDQLELTTGARYDKYEQFGSSVSPRIGAVYSATDKITLKALYGEAFRGPTYSELFIKKYDGANNIVPSDRANPDLEAEKIKTTEFEVSYTINKNFMSKARYFINKNENAIISLGQDIPYANIDGIETDGAEFELNYSFNKISGFTNCTFTHGEKSDGSNLDGYPDYQINSVLNYSPIDKIDSRLGVRFISERSTPSDYHDGLTNSDVVFLNSIDNLGGYFDVELGLTYHLNNNWSIAGNIYNLFDDENFNPSYEPGEYWDLIHPGRAYFVNLSYTNN
jgi:outer membrane receptor for ferrienterochelin and colicin